METQWICYNQLWIGLKTIIKFIFIVNRYIQYFLMKTILIEFSKYESVNFLWSELIEVTDLTKREKQFLTIDLQKNNKTKNNTMPIIFSGTGGLALIPIQMVKRNFKISCKDNQVLIFNLKRKSFQILNEATIQFSHFSIN